MKREILLGDEATALGAASPFLKLKKEGLLEYIGSLFSRKGETIVEMNKKAFELGLAAAQ